MTKKIKLKDTLNEFLFNQIKNDPDYKQWSDNFEMPNYITDNLSRTLRDYQIEAVKHFIYLFESGEIQKAKHILFNMATGTGKTLTMAAIILYLYEWGYRNFIFLVHQVQIKEQALANFTDPNFDKFLFKKQVKFNGKSISIKAIERFEDSKRAGINFMFFSTQMLYERINNPKENSISTENFIKNDTIIIADEAHRLNVNTKKKTEVADENNWETAVQSVLHANPRNLLLEFTATVDLKNEKIHQKYKDKLVYKYDFLAFNKDGYSKQVAFLYNDETQIADQKRLLIINAVVLSEYRRLLAEREMGVAINPVVLIKSVKIAQSEEDRAFFHKVISSLRVEDLKHLEHMAEEKKDLFDTQSLMIAQMFYWLKSAKANLATAQDTTGLNAFIAHIKERFSENNTMIYNSKTKEKAELLPLLDSPKNTIRAIFSVNALNEGWDVLSLYDIVHFDISETKKVSLQDIQLIGRGARLCPYQLPKSYHHDDLFSGHNAYGTDPFKRKFDQNPNDNGRMLETFYYHFVKTGTFLENLQKDLLGEGIINEGVEKRTIHLKPKFLQSQTYQKGFVLVNRQEFRSKNTQSDIDLTFNRQIIASSYKLHTHTLTDKEQNTALSALNYKTIKISAEYFSRHLLYKALILAENGFFRLNNLKKHIIGISSIDEMIDVYLPKCDIKYGYVQGKDIDDLSAHEKLQMLIGSILPEVRKAIDRYLPIVKGSSLFSPKPLSEIFQKQKNIYLVAYPNINEQGEKTFIAPDERAKAQSCHDNSDLQYAVNTADWYAYTENYGTSEEKRFVKFIASQIDTLKQSYQNAEIYLIRNELDYYLFDVDSGRRFSPDYMMIINDFQNKKMYYQCLFEPKGGHLLDKDKWKEQALIQLENQAHIELDCQGSDFDAYQEVKCLGFKFFNSEPRGVGDFGADFKNKL
ncbi:DEAD/DEAH box helicase family protein [Moraxella sp. RCAD0137]|uniref:DEAD/DEAH box helicase family protein n=1 Tax=Moraxella sp. RCAD0137 TaxID=1775913 RepID=UPI000C9F8758|nr:DEAD/DEAH box helicase family protein [Moraxella sp. RCAD0137]PNP97849.1 type III deoxyribonuclease [Moraxella sp. RCAD0137]